MLSPSEMTGVSKSSANSSLMNSNYNSDIPSTVISESSPNSYRSASPITHYNTNNNRKNEIVDRFERLKLENGKNKSQSVPLLSKYHTNGNDVAIEETDDENCIRYAKNIADLNSAKETLRKLSSASNDHSLKTSKSHVEFTNTAYDVRMLNKDISNTKINLEVEKVIIIVKKNEVSLIILLRELVEWLLTNYPQMTIYVQDTFENSQQFAGKEICTDSECTLAKIGYWDQKFIDEHDLFFDLCITLGGDGTVLFASTMFQKHVPPILSFSLGSLGFLTNFDFEQFKQRLPLILNQKVKTNLRMRLECKVYRRHSTKKDLVTGKKICYVECITEQHVLNEVTIDRGPSPFISMLELYGDGSLMTVAQADGLIIATPTGSTAYSLSAGGSLVYPSVNCIAVTPICPHTLSFRPIVLPDSMKLKVKVPLKSRSTAWVAFDGKNRVELTKGDYITICASPYIFPTVESSPTEFIDGINRTMNWNIRERQKSFTHILSRKNREKMATEVHSSESSEEEYIEEKRLHSLIHERPLDSNDGSSSEDSEEEEEHCCKELINNAKSS
ncbi:NAD(+) kinase [Monosporozyma unispora]|nr:NAD(+) kinase [Kazachstania unispora]